MSHQGTGTSLIGLMTRPGANADEIVRRLVADFGYRTIRLDAPIHRATLALCGVPDLDTHIPGFNLKTEQIAARMALFVRQQLSSQMLLQLAEQSIRTLPRGTRVLLVGLTQESEAAWIRTRGGRVLHVSPGGGGPAVTTHGDCDVTIRVGKNDLEVEFMRVTEILQLAPQDIRYFEESCA